MIDYKKIISNRELRLKIINLLRFIPDGPYLKMVYRIKTGKKLNLTYPQTYCDKLNWLKLHDIHPEYTQMADKIAVRDYIKEKIGKDICFPLLGTWEHYDDIDFDALPERFVLKCNHDSGSTKVITDKSTMNHSELKNFFEGRLKLNSYVLGREYSYRDIHPKILAEEYMVPNGNSDINDYKFLCFNGIPRVMFVVSDRHEDCRLDYYDMEFNHLPITAVYPNSDKAIEKPALFNEMYVLAARLSKGIPFVRIDLYEINGKIYFGEFTHFDGGGFYPRKPDEWEYRLGDWILIS